MRRALFAFAVVLGVYATVEVIVSTTALPYALNPEAARKPDGRLHHALIPNVSNGIATWGNARYPFRTNSLGFRDAVARHVPPKTEKSARVVIIGDSFTEGVGLPWEKTFVGLFALAHADVDVLNAGVASYSPSIYLRSIERLLEDDVSFDHVIVYVDISDIQDEAVVYHFDADGNVKDGTPAWQFPRTEWFFRHCFPMTLFARDWIRGRVRQPPDPNAPDDPQAELRGMWTVRASIDGAYGTLGVEGGIEKARANMTALANVLRARGIKFSVAVYPWPAQLLYDTVDSRAVSIWRSWCAANGCALFINHFPDFFARRDQPDWRDQLYIHGDVHFTEAGNKLVEQRLSEAFDSQPLP